jgi:hypothetical protein
MASGSVTHTPWWAWAWPLVAVLVLGVQLLYPLGCIFFAVEAFTLIATVFAAV